MPVPDDGAATNRSVTLEYYDIEGDSRVPVVMVLPMSGGGYTVERHFANYFASRGYAAVIVYRDKIPKDQQLLENLNPTARPPYLEPIDSLRAAKAEMGPEVAL